MQKIKDIVGTLFQSPVGNQSFPTYLSYINTAGKVTARSMLDIEAVLLTFAQEQEKKNEEVDEKFKQIFEILSKIVDEKQSKTADSQETVVMEAPDIAPENEFTCKICRKSFKSSLGLMGHSRTHKVV